MSHFRPPHASTGTAPCLAGLIGAGIGGSLTPAMHMAEGAAQGFPYVYRSIDLAALGLTVTALPELLQAAKRCGFDGLNITHPCKQAVLPLLDAIDPDAAALGAVNTVVLRDGRATGHNTDCIGFATGFTRGLGMVPMRRVAQLGAGGAGAAVAHALLTLGAGTLALVDADPARAQALASSLSARFGAGRAIAAADARVALDGADGLVNCTPIGMAAHPGLPLDAGLLHGGLWVAEIIYFPRETALLRAAHALGCRTLDGGGMATFQAVEAFRLITGREPDAARMAARFDALAAA